MKNKGFTLVEIMVVLSITLFLSAIILVDYRTGAKQFALERSAHKLAQDIRKAQGMAISTKELPGGIIPEGGYGIYLVKTADSYNIYADTGSEQYNSGEEMETLFLEKDVEIKDINLKKLIPPSTVSKTEVSINFKPPDPTVSLKTGTGEPFDELEITLALKTDANKIKKIIVNKTGLIYVSQ